MEEPSHPAGQARTGAQVGAGIDAEEGHNGIVVRGVAGGIVSSKVAGVPADWFNNSINATPRRVAQREVG